ncbi:MAG: ISAs1 family transposase [Clostridiales bacterium]|nr:ISAs1 family transposase [Clostridiales bacterium]
MADDRVEIADFAESHIDFLRKYIELKNGVPSHDIIQRVMSMTHPAQIQGLYDKWNELLNTNEGEKLKKIICIDGKTMRGNKVKDMKPQHIVSAWCDEDGFCLGQRVVDEKSNEITAIPKLLEKINIKGKVVTIDAMGTQTDISDLIFDKKGLYVLCVKGNQPTLMTEIQEKIRKTSGGVNLFLPKKAVNVFLSKHRK